MPKKYPLADKLLDLVNEASENGLSSYEIVSILEFFKLMTFCEFYKILGEKDGE
jgi:hypothetical protein